MTGIPGAAIDQLRTMSAAMKSYAPMSSGVSVRLAGELESQGPVAQLIGDHPDAAAPLFCMRALAGVRWLVLSGLAPALEAHLRHMSSRVGDPAYDERTWLLFRQTLLEHPQEIRAALDRPVQQHQPVEDSVRRYCGHLREAKARTSSVASASSS